MNAGRGAFAWALQVALLAAAVCGGTSAAVRTSRSNSERLFRLLHPRVHVAADQNLVALGGVDSAEEDAAAAVAAAEALAAPPPADAQQVQTFAAAPEEAPPPPDADEAFAAAPEEAAAAWEPPPRAAAVAAADFDAGAGGFYAEATPYQADGMIPTALAGAGGDSAGFPRAVHMLAGAPSPFEPASPIAAPPGIANEEDGGSPSPAIAGQEEGEEDGGSPSQAIAGQEEGEEDEASANATKKSDTETEADAEAEEAEAKAEADAELKGAEEDAEASVKTDSNKDEKKQDDPAQKTFNPQNLDSDLSQLEQLKHSIARDTKSKALADLLGSLKVDMFMLREKIGVLQSEVQDGVEIAPPDPDASLVYPVPVCMQCILLLTALYFVIYTALAVCKVIVDWFALGPDTLCESALRTASETVFYAPMLCVLFLGAQLRAVQISQGQRGPPGAAELGMQACAWSVFAQTLLVLAIPAFTGEGAIIGEDGIKFASEENRAIAGLLTVIRGAAIASLYFGLCLVCVVVICMDARSLDVKPVDVWDDPTTVAMEYAPPVSVAMQCTIGLTQLFFVVYLVHAVLQSMVQLLGQSCLPGSIQEIDRPNALRVAVLNWEECFQVCTSAIALAPMVCILFMTSRLRALELDPKEGRPQWWAEELFKVCTTAIVSQVMMVLGAQLAGYKSARVKAVDSRPVTRGVLSALGESDLEELSCAEAQNSERMIIGIRVVLAVIIHCCVAGICVSTIIMEGKDLGKPVPPFGPTLVSIILLCSMYFGVYLGLLLTQATSIAVFSLTSTVSQAAVATLLRLVRLFKMAECTIRFCPMLSLLFLGARERALLLSGFKGSPQCWAQDAMYASVAALLTQLLMVLGAGILSKNVTVDEAGSPKSARIKYVPGKFFLELVKAIAFVALYGGVIIVGVSVLVIRPETAGCLRRGFIPIPMSF
mmetsp:Transcript_166205/g.533580  ORF Transcript_166205/g.533580 Transcript_166205/m.533580 type:complete len:939 (-) Transcript_166205:135-2951(-)